MARPVSVKLSRRFYGPFKILERIGPVAYRLDLPADSKIHNDFHVGLLRPFVTGPSTMISVPLPAAYHDGHPLEVPRAILNRRIILQNGLPVEHGLVQWTEDDHAAKTWEPLDAITTRFPSLLLGDKEVLNEGGVDTSPTPQQTQQPTTKTNTEDTGPEDDESDHYRWRCQGPNARLDGLTTIETTLVIRLFLFLFST